MINEKSVVQILQGVKAPKMEQKKIGPMVFSKPVIAGEKVVLTLSVSEAGRPFADDMVGEVQKKIGALSGVSQVEVGVKVLALAELKRLAHPLPGLEKVRHVVAVASGKGGVGKTSVAVNLALALAGAGNRVGLLDADIYGPSVPLMLGLSGTEVKSEGEMALPVEKFGIRIMSLGMNVQDDQAFIWRGPLVSKMIRRLLGKVSWGELDYLVVDLPPGTGDPSITIARAIPRAMIVMVTTPQEVSLADVRRAITLFQKHGLKVVGLVENMSYFLCGHTEKAIEIFGHGGGEKLSKETNIPLLGALPIDLDLSKGGDCGVPVLVSNPDAKVSRVFHSMVKPIMDGAALVSA